MYRDRPTLPAAEALAELRVGKETAERVSEALRPIQQPIPRAIDVHGLFSTERDLFGGFTDVSPFIRGEDPSRCHRLLA